MNYEAAGRYGTEDEAKSELDTRGYSGKWRNAIARVTNSEKYVKDSPAYWDAVRLHFLELGGGWLAQRNPLPENKLVLPSRFQLFEEVLLKSENSIDSARPQRCQVVFVGFDASGVRYDVSYQKSGARYLIHAKPEWLMPLDTIMSSASNQQQISSASQDAILSGSL